MSTKFKLLRRSDLLSTVAFVTIVGVSGAVLPVISGSAAYAAADDCAQDSVCADQLQALLAGEQKAKKSSNSAIAPKKMERIEAFKISVDGANVVSGKKAAQSKAPSAGLDAVDLDVRFDGLDAKRQLAASVVGQRRMVKPGEPVEFYGNWNYPAWISRAEIRVYDRKDMPAGSGIRNDARPVDVVALEGNLADGSARGHWEAPKSGSAIGDNLVPVEGRDLVYTLRVYDDRGRFDETRPLAIKVTSEADNMANTQIRNEGSGSTPGQEVDNLAISNIPVHGGLVTVHGRNIPAGYKVNVMGSEVPLGFDETNSGAGFTNKMGEEYTSRQDDAFLVSRILPPGEHQINVDVAAANGDSVKSGRSLNYDQDVNIPDNDFFYVGLADVTVGLRTGEDSETLTNAEPGEYDDQYQKGRLAFYLKGKMKGKYILTAALDTTEKDLDNVFRDMDEKDPRQLLRRLDPDDYYPIYGDDSTIVEDAPTAGKFYVKLERGESHVMWGNFKTSIDGTELARFERGLYGAHTLLKSEETTSFGEPVAQVEGFGAQPGTLAQRDEMRGTGGSAYFLRHQDINQGSEQITVEERDRVTGLVVERRQLFEGRDYTIDHAQGVVILTSPLGSTTAASSVVRDTAIGGNHQYLVAQYEYTPGLEDVDGYSYGGRGEAWLGDMVRLGVSGYQEDTGIADQTLWGLDATIRLSEKSYFEFEWAESEGDTFGIVTSTDGGFIFNNVSGNGIDGEASQAWRAKVSLDLQELTGTEDENGKLEGGIKGKIGGYYEDRDAGFNAPGRYTQIGESIWGVFAEVEATENLKLAGRYDDVERDDGREKTEASVEASVDMDEEWNITVGVQHSDITDPGASDPEDTGRRTDLGVRLTRTISESYKVWAFGQVTLDNQRGRDRNDRGGVGFEKDLTDQITASAEVSYGTSGIGALAALSYEPTVDERYYLGYRLSAEDLGGSSDGVDYDPFGRDYGSLVYGATRKMDDRMSARMEHNFDVMGRERSRTQMYGVTYTPDEVWTLTGGLETGEVTDEVDGDFDRVAISGSMKYREPGREFGVRLESRFEDGDINDRDRDTFLGKFNVGLDYNDDWRFLAKVDAVISNSDEEDYLDGRYVEASVGWAYRPVEDDRFNALFKYTYLYDLPGYNQVNSHDEKYSYAQRSHVLEADFIYDINDYWSIGAKYGYRVGEVSKDRSTDDFRNDSAHLGIIRADMHVVKNWDVMLEGRVLDLPDLEQTHYGALAGVYRHLGDNFKVGVGYNFGEFSDDVTDLTLDDEGVFLNVVGKF